MILSVNYTHSSSLVHYILLGPDGTVTYDNIIPSGAQSITLSNSLPAGNYILYSMDPYDMNKVTQETVAIPNCIPNSPSATPSTTPSITPDPAISPSVTPSIGVSATPTITPTITPTPSPIWTTSIQMTKYPQVEGGGTIEIWNNFNIKILSKNTSELSIGSNSFNITPYSGPYSVYLSSIYKIDGPPAYTSISSNTGDYQTSYYGTMNVSGYGRLSSGISEIDITLGEPL